MSKTLAQKMAQLPASRRARVEARAAALIAEEMSLRDLRQAMNRTQVDVAKALKVGQDAISRYEQRADMLLSTLQGYVHAMGGELDLIAKFPNRGSVKLKALGDLAARPSSKAA